MVKEFFIFITIVSFHVTGHNHVATAVRLFSMILLPYLSSPAVIPGKWQKD